MRSEVQHFVFGDTHIPQKRWFSRSYIADWALIVLLTIFFFVVGFAAGTRERYLPPGDTSVKYPLENSIFPTWTLLIIGIVFPLSVFFLMQLFFRSRHDLHHSSLGLLSSLVITIFITEVIKHSVGRHRPNYEQLVQVDEREANLSFPYVFTFPFTSSSGHSSFSFSAMVFLSLYLNGKMHTYGKECGSLLKALFGVLPVALAATVAISRTIDFHHNFSDIIAGSLLGTGISFFVYFLYYPSLFSAESHIPKHKSIPEYHKATIRDVSIQV